MDMAEDQLLDGPKESGVKEAPFGVHGRGDISCCQASGLVDQSTDQPTEQEPRLAVFLLSMLMGTRGKRDDLTDTDCACAKRKGKQKEGHKGAGQ